MSGETARLMSARDLILKWWPEHGGTAEFLIAAIEWRDAATRRDALEEAAKIADTEPVPDDPVPIEMLVAGAVTAAIAGVISTKKCIAERIRRAAQQPCPARREDGTLSS